MDYSKIMHELDKASLFDLYRLQMAIRKELDNPERIEQIRQTIKAGDTISYFVGNENRLIEAEVLELKRTRVFVRNKHDMKRWDIPFYMVNVEGISVDIVRPEKTRGINRHEIRIGDWVGFRDKANNNLRGKVIHTNPKTVSLLVEPNQKWRVSYSMLHAIIDGQKVHEQLCIESVVVGSNSD
ncbi:MAG: hypothetical protein ACYC54_15440 [Sedimentisphaerales bacterium]